MSEKLVLPNALMLGEVSALLSEGHDVTIMTKGNSMLPFIRGEKDSVLLRKTSAPAVGDIALAEVRKGVYVLHRISAIDGDAVTLHGDGNLKGDEHCRIDNVKGIVMRICLPSGKEIDCRTPRALKRAVLWNRQPYLVRRVFLGIYRRLI